MDEMTMTELRLLAKGFDIKDRRIMSRDELIAELTSDRGPSRWRGTGPAGYRPRLDYQATVASGRGVSLTAFNPTFHAVNSETTPEGFVAVQGIYLDGLFGSSWDKSYHSRNTGLTGAWIVSPNEWNEMRKKFARDFDKVAKSQPWSDKRFEDRAANEKMALIQQHSGYFPSPDPDTSPATVAPGKGVSATSFDPRVHGVNSEFWTEFVAVQGINLDGLFGSSWDKSYRNNNTGLIGAWIVPLDEWDYLMKMVSKSRPKNTR